MPRPKKGSPEAKAWAAEMKAKREAKQQEPKEEVSPSTEIIHDDNVNALLKRIEELEKRQFFPPQSSAPPMTPRTVVTKYSFNPADYPNPVERFFTESKLKLKGFTKDWWDVGYEVQKVNYEEDGTKYVAPRFKLELYRILEDEETGEPSVSRFTRKIGLFFEDPDSFLEIASQHGLNIPESFEKEFMDEMRYLTMRDWLVDIFYPPKSTDKKSNKVETVIGNQLVEVFEVSSVDPVRVNDSDVKWVIRRTRSNGRPTKLSY